MVIFADIYTFMRFTKTDCLERLSVSFQLLILYYQDCIIGISSPNMANNFKNKLKPKIVMAYS